MLIASRGPSNVVECFKVKMFNPECPNLMLGVGPWENELVHEVLLTVITADHAGGQKVT